MTALRGMHIPDTAYIPLNGKNIGNAEMNELSEIRLGCFEKVIRNEGDN